jgi:hypothetical protein
LVDIAASGAGRVTILRNVTLRLESVFPARGPVTGGGLVRVSGTGLVPGTRLLVGAQEATDVEVVAGKRLLGLVPAGTAGPADITAINPSGRSFTLRGAYTYEAGPVTPPLPPTGAVFQPQRGRTVISWQANGAAAWSVQLNGRQVCEGAATRCEIPTQYGPLTEIDVIARAGELSSAPTAARYRKPASALTAATLPARGVKATDRRQAKRVARALVQQGWPAATVRNRSMARAKAVARVMERDDLTVAAQTRKGVKRVVILVR